MKQPRIAIHLDEYSNRHSSFWSHEWIKYCLENSIEYCAFDFLSDGVVEKLKEFDIALCHFSHYDYRHLLFARSVLRAATQMGVRCFPGDADCWHFDDKISQSLALRSVGAPIPEFHTFFRLDDFEGWIATEPLFPLVAKLKSGSGSHNVILIQDKREARRYARRMLSGRGMNAAPDILLKAKSNVRSAQGFNEYLSKAKRVPEFLATIATAKSLPRERGYTYFQEFIENDGFDLKIVTLGEKISYFARSIRAGDFRASGGGSFFYNKSLVPIGAIKDAISASKSLGAQCMGYDFVVDKTTGQGKIIEMSYGFSHSAIMGAGGYWIPDGDEVRWVDDPLNVPIEIIKGLISRVECP